MYDRELCAKFINQIESIYQESQTKAYLIGGPKDLVDALFEQLTEYQIIVKIYDLDLDYYYYSIILFNKSAGVAQLVEQLICNQPVAGSSPITSSFNF